LSKEGLEKIAEKVNPFCKDVFFFLIYPSWNRKRGS
jgi:hypothetical protein